MLKNIIYILLPLAIGCAKIDSYKWVQTLPQPWKLTEKELGSYLLKFQSRYPDYKNRLIALNLWRVGTPYGIFCLGEEKGIDTDPIIRIDTSDCTVHVLTTIAYAESKSVEEAREKMIQIHYKPDENGLVEPNYKSRWHYTSDRLLNNAKTPDITSKIAPAYLAETIQIEINRKIDGTQFLDLDWTSKESLKYIPSTKINQRILDKLPDICGVAFVKKSYFKNGIVIAHEGYIINKENLIHASSDEKMTVNVDFLTYLFKGKKPRFDGVMFYDIVEG